MRDHYEYGCGVVTLGVDLAASPKRTAVCWIDWADGRAEIRDARAGATDEELLGWFERADKVGIDAPFGWPDAFVESIASHREGRPWPGHPMEHLRLRETDRHAHERTGIWPLSVSSNLVAIPAMRCAGLLSRYGAVHGPVPRDGSGKLVEVYPAAALKRWGLPHSGYKGKANAASRAKLVQQLRDRTEPWLAASDEIWGDCSENDDVLDAVVAALAARAAATGRCAQISAALTAAASREGWIRLPHPDSLSSLATVTARHNRLRS